MLEIAPSAGMPRARPPLSWGTWARATAASRTAKPTPSTPPAPPSATRTNTTARGRSKAAAPAGSAKKTVAWAGKGAGGAARGDAPPTAATERGTRGRPATGSLSGNAYAINPAGTAVGASDKYDGSGTFEGVRAVRWDSST